jgi:hypothetical protein
MLKVLEEIAPDGGDMWRLAINFNSGESAEVIPKSSIALNASMFTESLELPTTLNMEAG